jgi:hypothetical protein
MVGHGDLGGEAAVVALVLALAFPAGIGESGRREGQRGREQDGCCEYAFHLRVDAARGLGLRRAQALSSGQMTTSWRAE